MRLIAHVLFKQKANKMVCMSTLDRNSLESRKKLMSAHVGQCKNKFVLFPLIKQVEFIKFIESLEVLQGFVEYAA